MNYAFVPRHSALTLESFGREAFGTLATPGLGVQGVFSKGLPACKHLVTASAAHVHYFHDSLGCNGFIYN